MGSFRKEVDSSTKIAGSCLEEDNREIVSEDDCYYAYSGEPILKKFDDVPPNKICCQLDGIN